MMARIATASSNASSLLEITSVFRELTSKLSEEKPQLLLIFASTACPLEPLMRAKAEVLPGVPPLGSSTSGEFNEKVEGKNRFVAWLLGGDDVVASTGIGFGLKAGAEAALTAALPQLAEDKQRPCMTAIVMLDPLSGNGEEAALIASSLLGPTVRLAGGAAGDDLQFKKTTVACGTAVASDAVVLALLACRKPLGSGVQHGHTPLSRPLGVTKAEGATVFEI